MFRFIIIISVIFAFTVLGTISLIHKDYKGAVIWLGLSVLILFSMSYSKHIKEVIKNKFSTDQIKKLTKKIFTDMVF